MKVSFWIEKALVWEREGYLAWAEECLLVAIRIEARQRMLAGQR
jgi:hypothetical protein